MSTTAKEAEFRRDLKRLDAHRAEIQKPEGQRDASKIMAPRDRIKIRLRCRICGRSRAVYRKFGICRICLRNLASDGMIPGMRKASW